MLLALWSGFWDWGGEPTPQTTGGVDDYHAYRKRLKKIASAADRRIYGKMQKSVAKLIEQAPPEVIETAKQIERAIDFEALAKGESQLMAKQLDMLLLKLDELVREAIIRDEEEEILILMAIA